MKATRRYAFICNPGSGSRHSEADIGRIVTLARRRGLMYESRLTNTLDDARVFSMEENAAGADVVVAVGGDGTINQVINGFYDGMGRRRGRSLLGAIYTGTSPDFCKSYGIPLNHEKALELLIRAPHRRVNVGSIVSGNNLPCASGRNEPRRFFACCANIGLGASLARMANSGIRGRIGDVAGTFVSLLRLLGTFRPLSLRLRCDDRLLRFDNTVNVSIGKTRHIASGIQCRHRLTPGDDRFYVMAVGNISASTLVPCFIALYTGRMPRRRVPWISLTYARRIEVEPTGGGIEVECDGDPVGAEARCIEQAQEPLDLICEPSPC